MPGLTILEVLVGISILLVGILSLMTFFPAILRANERAELRTIGGGLALMKIEELRRDDDLNDQLIESIRNLTAPTPAITFPHEPRLAYRFSGVTALYTAGITDPDDSRDDPGIARVIIQESPNFRANPSILDEYRFQ